jgi:hypothetical protein
MEVIQSDIEVVFASNLEMEAFEAFQAGVISHSVDGEYHYVRQAVRIQVEIEIARLIKEKDGIIVECDSIFQARREARAEGKKFVIIID